MSAALKKRHQSEIALVVSAAVWRDFNAVREAWGDYCVNGFDYDCKRNERQAIKAGDLIAALHWRAVQWLAVKYGESPFCAIEVDGEIIREVNFPSSCYPPDAALYRVQIGAPLHNQFEQGRQS